MKLMTSGTMGVVPYLPIVLLALSGSPTLAGSAFRGANIRNEANLSETDNINWRNLQADDSVCTTSTGDIPGIQDKDVCCPVTCGQCGGSGCSSAPGGEDSCCTSAILEAGDECGEAPCVIGESAPTPAATTPTPVAAPTPVAPVTTTMCTDDTEGVLSFDGVVCCSLGCDGQCGGPGCGSFGSGAGLGSESCCIGAIMDSGITCGGEQGAPCIVETEEVSAPTTPAPATPTPATPAPATPAPEGPAPATPAPATLAPTSEDEMCEGGIVGVQALDVCCALSCGSCGGVGCSSRDGGEDNCCGAQIRIADNDCSVTGEAPCIVTSPVPATPAPATPAPVTSASATLAPTREAGTCEGGIVGVQALDVCCALSCDSCGGVGCSSRDGGEDNCCGAQIRIADRDCSVTGEAPCIVTSPTPAPATPAPTPELSMCDGGIVGIQTSDVCCSASCGSCGGTGCSGRDGGSGACCGGGVRASGRYCSVTGEAPCMTGAAPTPEPTPAPTPPPTVEVPMCDGGIVGIQASDVCCSASCGSCAGTGCSGRDGGSGACCGGGVQASGRYCSVTGEAPCMTGPAPTPEPTPAPTPPPTVEVPMCDGGIVGIQTSDVCCSASCGSCGGTGCSSRDGGSGACCGGGVRASGRYCSVTGEAPCMTGAAPTPEPTPAPTPPPTVEVPMCDGGIVGIQTSDVCCSTSCGSCGGTGCSGRDGGSGACCGGGVRASGRYCSVTGEAPCMTGSAPTPVPTPAPTPPPTVEVPKCDGGIVGIQASDVCCSLSCESCGGSGCSGRDGGEDECCGGGVRASGRDCSVTGEAPCIVTSPEPSTPAPTPAPTRAAGTCDGGIVGVQASDVCCALSCGSCGGDGCSDRDGGEDNCCGVEIRTANLDCSVTGEAPCIVTSPEPSTPAPATPAPATPAPTPAPSRAAGTCEGGIVGVQASNVCCALSCGSCGGDGCSDRDGGEDNCCGVEIRTANLDCSVTGEAPCIVTSPEPSTPAPATPAPATPSPATPAPATPSPATPAPATTAPTPAPSRAAGTCEGGIVGVQASNVCCALSCGSCGGDGCSDRDGGEDNCCGVEIRTANLDCSVTGEAPCIVTSPEPSTPAPATPAPATPSPATPSPATPAPGTPSPATPAPATPAPATPAPTPAPSRAAGTCEGGIVGVQASNVCCALSCGSCGGDGCSDRDGGEDNCCGVEIRTANLDCSDTGEAPCIVTSPAPTPAPSTTVTTTAPPTTVTTTAPPTMVTTTAPPTTVTTTAPPTMVTTTAPPTPAPVGGRGGR